MTTWFVSRHPGAIEWARRRGLSFDRHVAQLDPESVAAGDRVLGSLPVNHAARVCERGARFFGISIQLPLQARGCELSADDLERYGAKLEGFEVRRLA